MKKTYVVSLILLALCVVSLTPSVEAREFRSINHIKTPGKVPQGAVAVSQQVPPSREDVTRGVHELMDAWNNGNISEKLADNFYDAQLLEDTISTFVPRDAKIRVLGIQGQQLLQQYEKDGARVSRVSVTVRQQVEFSDPDRGFLRVPGVTELILRITEPAGGQ
jgi:hypothetical protein